MSLFSPMRYVASVDRIDLEELWRQGKRALLLDRDNTLVPRDRTSAPDSVATWLAAAHAQQPLIMQPVWRTTAVAVDSGRLGAPDDLEDMDDDASTVAVGSPAAVVVYPDNTSRPRSNSAGTAHGGTTDEAELNERVRLVREALGDACDEARLRSLLRQYDPNTALDILLGG